MVCGFSWRRIRKHIFRLYVRNKVPGPWARCLKTPQYNQMMLPAQDANQPVDIGFNEFALADWWLASHPVASPHNPGPL